MTANPNEVLAGLNSFIKCCGFDPRGRKVDAAKVEGSESRAANIIKVDEAWPQTAMERERNSFSGVRCLTYRLLNHASNMGCKSFSRIQISAFQDILVISKCAAINTCRHRLGDFIRNTVEDAPEILKLVMHLFTELGGKVFEDCLFTITELWSFVNWDLKIWDGVFLDLLEFCCLASGRCSSSRALNRLVVETLVVGCCKSSILKVPGPLASLIAVWSNEPSCVHIWHGFCLGVSSSKLGPSLFVSCFP